MKSRLLIRKSHRYLGLFIGIQFLFWTISGLYFSWTNLDEIHGDHFKIEAPKMAFATLKNPNELYKKEAIFSIELRNIDSKPFYWINNKVLIDAENGIGKNGISQEEAIAIAKNHINNTLKIKKIELISTIDKHHEYREKKLPAYVIEYEHKDLIKAYISKEDGKFQTIRHKQWRWFDFLWMTHTMDYESRDDINNWLLRIFSALGLITVCSGFLLWFVSSRSISKFRK